LPARKLHTASKLTPDQCALVETLAIGCHAVDRANPRSGENVLVIGAGPIGLSAIEFAKLSGARTIVMDIAESRLAFVREQMALPDTVLVRGDESDVAAVRELTNGQMADVVIDATGNSRSMVRAMEFAAFAGRVVYVGITQQNLEFPHAPFLHRRELTLLASRNALSRDFSRIIDLIEQGSIETRPWITHHAIFDEVPAVFPSWLRPEDRRHQSDRRGELIRSGRTGAARGAFRAGRQPGVSCSEAGGIMPLEVRGGAAKNGARTFHARHPQQVCLAFDRCSRSRVWRHRHQRSLRLQGMPAPRHLDGS
jgi:hypothetical protein